jgi:hypothetical protein
MSNVHKIQHHKFCVETSGYTTLGSYNRSQPLNLPPSFTSHVYHTPTYGAIGYDALTHGATSNRSHFTISDAYGHGADKCTTAYVSRQCH